MADTEFNFKALNKIGKTKEALRYNTSFVRESQLEDKLYKQFIELADEMIASVQKVINILGDYNNAGYSERSIFEEELSKCRCLNHGYKVSLMHYIDNLINNLKHN